MRTISNTLIIVGTIVLGFVFLAVGGTILAKFSSAVVLSQPNKAARDVSTLFIMAKGIPGKSEIYYQMPQRDTTSGSKSLTFEISPELLKVSGSNGNKDMRLPNIDFPEDYDESKIPREIEDVEKSLIIISSNGRIENVQKDL